MAFSLSQKPFRSLLPPLASHPTFRCMVFFFFAFGPVFCPFPTPSLVSTVFAGSPCTTRNPPQRFALGCSRRFFFESGSFPFLFLWLFRPSTLIPVLLSDRRVREYLTEAPRAPPLPVFSGSCSSCRLPRVCFDSVLPTLHNFSPILFEPVGGARPLSFASP